MNTRVLVLGDDAQSLRALATNLRARNYEPELATVGREAPRLASEQRPGLVILDVGTPNLVCPDIVRGLRGSTDAPIIVLSVRVDETDAVATLDAGADDYMAGSFGMNELLARIRAALRRSALASQTAVLDTADFRIDLSAKRAERHGTAVHLTPTEWSLIEELVRTPGQVVGQRHLLKKVWGPAYEQETQYLRNYIGHLRRKLEPDPHQPRYVLTEPGVGYLLRLAPEGSAAH